MIVIRKIISILLIIYSFVILVLNTVNKLTKENTNFTKNTKFQNEKNLIKKMKITYNKNYMYAATQQIGYI